MKISPSKTYLEIGEYKSPKLMKPSASDLVSSVFAARTSWVDKLPKADQEYIREVIVVMKSCGASPYSVASKLVEALSLTTHSGTVARYLKDQMNAKK